MNYVGLGIFLLIVGAIFKFAITATVAGLSLAVLGGILLLAGLLVLIYGVTVGFGRRRN